MSILDAVQPIVREKALQLKDLVKSKHGIEIIFTSGYRDPQEQAKIYSQGRDATGKIIDKSKVISYAKPYLSFHNYGLAIDFVPLKMPEKTAWWTAPLEIWEKIGKEAELLGFEWGGRWVRKDKPHLEYHPGLTIGEVKKYFLKTGKVLIEKTLTPVALLIVIAGVFFLIKYVKKKL